MSEVSLLSRLARMMMGRANSGFNGARNYDELFGYPAKPDPQYYKELYDRNGIASRIIRAFPQATWRDWPSVKDEGGDDSVFKKEWDDLVERGRLPHYFERADRLAGVGRFAVLLIGNKGGKDLSKPIGKGALNYLMPYADWSTTIDKWCSDTSDPRYGQPEIYSLQFKDSMQGGDNPNSKTTRVHHSRLIHVAEFLEQDDVYGTPRLQAVVNDLHDLLKTKGGSAEAFWLTANRGMTIGIDKEYQATDEDIKNLKEQAEEYLHQLRRTIVGEGITSTVLGSEVADPKNTIDVILDLIAGGVGIPKRILLGSERGELSSNQDENNWAARIDERRTTYAGPMILKPFIEKMIDIGELSEPKGEWSIEWSQAAAASDKEKAEIANSRCTALKTYFSAPGIESAVAPQEVREWMGLTPDSEYELVEPDEPIDEETGEALKVDPLTGRPIPKAPAFGGGGPVDPKTGEPLAPNNPKAKAALEEEVEK